RRHLRSLRPTKISPRRSKSKRAIVLPPLELPLWTNNDTCLPERLMEGMTGNQADLHLKEFALAVKWYGDPALAIPVPGLKIAPVDDCRRAQAQRAQLVRRIVFEVSDDHVRHLSDRIQHIFIDEVEVRKEQLPTDGAGQMGATVDSAGTAPLACEADQ